MVSSDLRTVYVYDGSFEGFLSAVFDAWQIPQGTFGDIVPLSNTAPSFTDKNISVYTDAVKAMRVRKWLRHKLPEGTEERIYEYFCAEDLGGEGRMFRYLKACDKFGAWVDSHLTESDVSDFLKAEKQFGYEFHRMRGFTRFKLLADNVLFAEINTDYNQLPRLGAFFLDRLPGQRFIIYDKKRKKAVLSDGRRLAIADNFNVDSIETDDTQGNFEKLWREYLVSVTTEQRKNKKLQRQMLPIKYRNCMTEFE